MGKASAASDSRVIESLNALAESTLMDQTAPDRPPIFILAGGLGTRLGDLTKAMPKALVPVAGKAFLFHQLDLLQESGFRSVVLCVGRLGEQIEEQVGSTYGPLEIEYSYDGETSLGTGGALVKAFSHTKVDHAGVLYGDSYLDLSYGDVCDDFKKRGTRALMTLQTQRSADVAFNVSWDPKTQRVFAYQKNPVLAHANAIDYGFTLLEKEAWENGCPRQTPWDFGDLMHDLAQAGLVTGYEVAVPFYEIGTPHSLRATEKHILRKQTTTTAG